MQPVDPNADRLVQPQGPNYAALPPDGDALPDLPEKRHTALAAWGLVIVAVAAVVWGLLCDQVPAMMLSLALTAVAGAAIVFWGARRHVVVLMLALAALSLFRVYYVVDGPFDLSGDEAHYWDWSRHMDWSFCTKGPGAPALIWLGRQVFGETVLAVRGPAVVLAFFSSLLLFRLGARLADGRIGALAAGLFQIVPIYAAFAVGMNTDPPLIFFWLASLLLLHHATTTAARWPWLLMGVTIGLGFLSKYTMAAFFICAMLYLLSSRERRRFLRTPWPYLAALVAAAVMSPVFYWNLRHGWVNIRHNLTHISGSPPAGAETDTSKGPLLNLIEFVGAQLGIITPILLALMVIALIRRRRRDAISFWFSVPLLVLFLFKSLLGEVLTNWALAAYLTGLIGFSAYYLKDTRTLNVHVRRLVVTAIIVAAVCTVLAHYPGWLVHAWQSVSHRENGDPTRKVRGWSDLGIEVARLDKRLDGRPHFIFSGDYMIASSLAFHVAGHPQTYCWYDGKRRFNQFDFWPGYGGLVGQDAIYIRGGNENLPAQLQGVFKSYEKVLFPARDRYGNAVKPFSIFICHDFAGMKIRMPQKY